MIRVLLLVFCFLLLTGQVVNAQEGLDTGRKDPNLVYVIQRFDGDVFVGKVVYEDPAMIKFAVKKLGVIPIRKHDIEIIRPVNGKMTLALGDYTPNEVFSTHYFLTSNVLPVEQKENYGDINLFGPDIHKFFLKNLDLQITSSWVLLPVVANIKYAITITNGLYAGVGVLGGWTPWGYSNNGGIIGYGSLCAGNRQTNLSVMAGTGTLQVLGLSEQRNIFSLAGMTKLGRRTSLVFDSFVMPSGNSPSSGFGIFMPGIRFQSESSMAFQLGLGAFVLNSVLQPAPVPMVQWFKAIR